MRRLSRQFLVPLLLAPVATACNPRAPSRELFSIPPSSVGRPAACSTNPLWCIQTVTKSRVLEAEAKLAAWEQAERGRSYFEQPGHFLAIPLDGTLLRHEKGNRRVQPDGTETVSQYTGNWQLIYTIRRAAAFVEALFSPLGLDTVTIVRLNTKDTEPEMRAYRTQVNASGGMDAHMDGCASDVAHILEATGRERSETIDYERNFWFLYALTTSPHFEMVMTDYGDELDNYARLALDQGLLASDPFHRTGQSIWWDSNYNHDSHMHVKVKGCKVWN